MLFVHVKKIITQAPRRGPGLKFRLRFFLRSVTNRSHVLNTHARTYLLVYTCNLVMADKAKLRRLKVITNTMDNTLKAHTKYAPTDRGRPTLKYFERFRIGPRTLR